MAYPILNLNITCYPIYAECLVVELNVVRKLSPMAIMVDPENM
jgi:hypothetical protein